MTTKIGILVILAIQSLGNITAQVTVDSPLFLELKQQDSMFFERGFNRCDISYMEKTLDEGLKFYHDKGGFQDKQTFLKITKQNICGNADQKPIRKLLENSLEVFPLYDNGTLYGAIQSGTHQFFTREKNKADVLGGQAKFTTVWLKKEGTWKISDILSYDHGPANVRTSNEALPLQKKSVSPTVGIGIIEEGKLTQIKVSGNLYDGTAAPYNALFNVASLTKPVTAIIVLRLVSLGKWKLDEPLYPYYTDPDLAQDPRHRKLTTRYVLSHQTGLPNWRWMQPDGKLRFDFDPGTRYQYSGEGFEYLRKAIEKKFGKSWEELAQELLFQPLQMKDTSYLWNDKKNEQRWVAGYDKNGKAYDAVKNKTANAADDLTTSLEDYSRFLIAVLNGEGWSQDVLTSLKTKHSKIKENQYFGLGFVIYDLGNGEIALAHSGADEGVNTVAFLLPKTKQGLVIFTNAEDGYKMYAEFLSQYFGEAGKKIVEIETR